MYLYRHLYDRRTRHLQQEICGICPMDYDEWPPFIRNNNNSVGKKINAFSVTIIFSLTALHS